MAKELYVFTLTTRSPSCSVGSPFRPSDGRLALRPQGFTWKAYEGYVATVALMDWGPPNISWFRFAPITIVISTINIVTLEFCSPT